LAHIDTLRIQNPVVAPVDGTILDVLVADGTPVEYGQPVLVIRPDAPDQ
jgi:acetyl-CoA carboxylase biotin carboxyl carrier protein